MSNFRIITDSCSDLGAELAQELGVQIAPLGVDMDGKFFEDGTMSGKEFYDAMRAGKVSTTSAVNPKGWMALMEPIVANGEDVLVIAFASSLSTTYQSAVIAAEEVTAKHPERKIMVVDTLSASVGQGMLVWHAVQMQRGGASLEETYQWVLDNRLHIAHWVTVEDLKYLKRGGRISATTAVLGTMLSIKPIIRVNDEGKLDSVAKARGRKASLNSLAEQVGKSGMPGKNDKVFIGQADCLEDAQYIAEVLKEKHGVKEVVIASMGSVIGSHVGPGGILVSFMADKR